MPRKLSWKVVLLCYLVLTVCEIFVLLNRLNTIESSFSQSFDRMVELQSHDTEEPPTERGIERPTASPGPPSDRSLAFDTEAGVQTRLHGHRLQSATEPSSQFNNRRFERPSSPGTPRIRLLATRTVAEDQTSHQGEHQGYRGERAKDLSLQFNERRIERPSSAPGPPSNRLLATHTAAWNETSRQGHRPVSANPTLSSRKGSRKSRNLPGLVQNYEEADREHYNPLVSTTATDLVEMHQRKENQIVTSLPSFDETTLPPPSPSHAHLSRKDEPLDYVVLRRNHGVRQNNEVARNKILMTIRTTISLHKKRLPLLFDTWLTTVNTSNVFLVTDGIDEEYVVKTKQLGMHYINVSCGKNYSRWSLCCKSGEEMSLMFRPEYLFYDWYCHLDDDMYLIEDNLVTLLSQFNAKKEQVYLGRAGNGDKPYFLSLNQTLLENINMSFHFAVGGMYCISRPLLEIGQPWLRSGEVFGKVCDQLYEPEDVAVGAVMGLLLNVPLSKTKLIQTHGLVLKSKVRPSKLKLQVAISYGCGQLCDHPMYKNNAVRVPKAKFPREKDPSRFKSLHCYLYPDIHWCQVYNDTETTVLPSEPTIYT